MAFFKRNQSPMLPRQLPQSHPPRERKPATKQDKIRMAVLICTTVVSTLLYFAVIKITETSLLGAQDIAEFLGIGIMVAYAAIGAGFLIAYIIYNRAFTRDNITTEMLPDTMSEHEKIAFIQSSIDRKRKSKWMIVVLFAAFTPLAIDFLILNVIPTLFASWGIK